MIRYVLDTDMLSLFQKGHDRVAQHVAAHAAEQLATTIITVEEQLTGWYTQLRRARQRDALARAYQRLTDAVRFLNCLNILSFTEAAIVRYEQLLAGKVKIGKMDLRIAAIALENGATLVSRNLRDFSAGPKPFSGRLGRLSSAIKFGQD